MAFRLKQLVVCLFAVFLLQTAVLCSGPEYLEDESGYPAEALRFLAEGNQRGPGISPFDELVKRYAAGIGMDWRLLSAIIWHESQYNASAVSPMSAKGLMQIRDVTAVHFGCPDADLFNPAVNLRVGTMLLDELMRSFRAQGVAPDDVVRFALASYNSGGGALSRRREEAATAGLDPNKWEDVATAYRQADNSTTPAYIDAVEATYQRYCERY